MTPAVPARARFLLSAFAVFLLAPAVPAQEESVKPGINNSYESPNVERIVKSYERDSRDVVQHSEEILAACGLKPGMVVADIGAGTGLHTRPMARKVVPGGKVIAVEITKPFVEHIEKSCREAGIENVVGHLSTPTSAELEPESIDLAFTCDTYHHFEYPFKMLDSIHEALKPGGHLVIVDYKKEEGVSPKWVFGHVRANKKQVIEEAARSGFKLFEDHSEIMEQHYVLRFEKVEK
jgi:predicted methyltransferase